MHWTNLPPGDSAELLAWEDALLQTVEDGAEPVLWFWESSTVFVVVGYGQTIDQEVKSDECLRRGVPIFRRSSGGGAVVQGPGCLNYGLALRLQDFPNLATVTQANHTIMSHQAAALNRLLQGSVSVQGFTDLALRQADGSRRKFSGNAQRRTRHALLFHGTFLCHFDLSLLSQLLPLPKNRPDYREDRPHHDFVCNLDLSPDRIRETLKDEWKASDHLAEWPTDRHQQALRDRYRRVEWHRSRSPNATEDVSLNSSQ